jgi:DNA-binding NarL/FixJ family response regulator
MMADRRCAPVSLVRVLVVDDQALFRRVMGAVVEETDGFVLVGCAASGEESIVSAGVLRPDLVLMDVNLPGIDGMEATRRLRADAAAAAVVLLSTYDEDDWDGQAEECSAVACVAKSAFGLDRLTEVWAMTSR